MDEFAQSFIRISRVDKQHVRPLFIIVADQVVHEERLAAARRSQNEFVAVGRDAALDRLIGDVEVERYAAQTIDEFDTEGRRRRTVGRLFSEEAEGLFEECRKRLLGGKLALGTRYAGPEERRHIDRIAVRRAAHERELRAHVVADALELRFAVGPYKDVAVAAHGAVPFGVGFVQVEVDPLLIHGVGTRVPRQRVHVAGSRFEAFERLGVVVQKNVE